MNGAVVRDFRGLDQPSIPVAYAQLLIDILSQRGIAQDDVLGRARLPAAIFDNTAARITPRQWSRLVLSGIRLSQDPCLGYDYGLRMRPTAHGVLGYAMMSAPTFGDALSVLIQYFSMRLRSITATIAVTGDDAVITLAETSAITGVTADDALQLRRFFYECVLLGGIHMSRFLLQRDLAGATLHFDWNEPPCHARHREGLPPVFFGMHANQLRFPATELSVPLPTADALAFRQAMELCELERLRSGAEDQENFIQRVRAELVLTPYHGFPDQEEVARRLTLSRRTLKRRLALAGVTFLALVEEARRQEAENLLATTTLPVQEIASRLGYLGPANFTRAFRKWTAMTPTDYRRQPPRQQGA